MSEEASLFFRLLVYRDEPGSVIVTSNKRFVDWSESFNDQVLVTDRLLHHVTMLTLKAESDRLREKKAGLLGRRFITAAEEGATDSAIGAQ